MIKNNCQHEWEKHVNATKTVTAGAIPAYFICKKCSTEMTAPEIYQLEALENQTKALENETKLAEHQMGFQKWLSSAAVVISFVSLVIATLVAIYK